MATYAELLSASNDPTLRQKVRIAVLIAAETVRNESTGVANHTPRLAWAKKAFNDPESVTPPMLGAVLAQNKAVAIATILASSDAQVQTAVDAAVDVFT
jgi:hypothetical protein